MTTRFETRKLLRLATTTAKQFIDVDLSYDKRGHVYELDVRAVEVGDGFVKCRLYFDGVGRRLIETAARFNRKRFDSLSDMLITSAVLQAALAEVLQARGLALAEQTEAQACVAAVS